MSNDFTPIIQVISKLKTPFTLKIILSIHQLPPNQLLELHVFTPKNEHLDPKGFSSNNKGYCIDEKGKYEILFEHTTSDILPNGLYKFGINLGFIKHIGKLDFNNWYKSPNLKKYKQINFNFENITILKLDDIGNVPWGKNTTVSGHLWFKDVDIEKEPQIMPNGAGWFIGRKIYFTGTNQLPNNIETDAFGKFLEKFQVDDSHEQNCYLQAHYDGDNKYFDKCDSNKVYYNIIKHRTALIVKIDNLKLNPFNKNDSIDSIKLESNKSFRIKGTLIDKDSNVRVKDQKIDFETNLPYNIRSLNTDGNGSFQIDNLIVPSKLSQYNIGAISHGDDFYESAKSNIVKFENIVEEDKTKKITGILHDRNDFESNRQILTINPSAFHARDLTIDKDLCFVLMPFQPNFYRIFEDHIKPTLKKKFKRVIKADDIYESNSIIEDIWIQINKARLIIADVTNKKPNVFYELGIAHTVGKDVIIITQNEDDIPFDISYIRYIHYNDNEEGWNHLKEILLKFTNVILSKK
jgi:hypothetical protein